MESNAWAGGGDRAFSILLDLPGAFLHKLKYRLARLGGPEFRVKGEKVLGRTVAALPPALLQQELCPVQVSLEHAKEMWDKPGPAGWPVHSGTGSL